MIYWFILTQPISDNTTPELTLHDSGPFETAK